MPAYDRQATKQTFDLDGYLVIPGFFTREEVAALHEQMERYVKDVVPGLPAPTS